MGLLLGHCSCGCSGPGQPLWGGAQRWEWVCEVEGESMGFCFYKNFQYILLDRLMFLLF